MTREELKKELYHYIATQCSAVSINLEHRLVYHYDQMEKVGEFIYNLEEKRIVELEAQIEKMKCCDNCALYQCEKWKSEEVNYHYSKCDKWELRS